MKKLIFSVTTAFLLTGSSFAQNTLFDDTRISSIFITIAPDSLAVIYDSVLSDHYYMARFIFDDGEKRDTLENVGFRLRGNTSRYSQKKSFKISFNEYVSGRKYQGVKKINLNGEHNDPTMIREKLYYELWKKSGMVERRTSFTRVYINQNYYGLYTNLEEMDKDWLERVYSDKSGNLYKCTYPADLVYHGTNQQTYKNLINSTASGGRVYELQTNESQDDYSRLVELISAVYQPYDSIFAINVSGILQVDNFLKALALDVATGNWDDYSYNKNNFYLYDNPDNLKFDFVTYDPDNTFGVDWFDIDWASRDCRNWINNEISLPLVQKLLAVPAFFDKYKSFLDNIARTIINPDSVFPRIDELKQLIQQAAIEDIYRTLDYGYSVADFNNAFTKGIDSHTPYGLKPFLTKRMNSILNQLHPSGTILLLSENERIRIYPNPASEYLNVISGFSTHGVTSVKVFDVLGKIAGQQSYQDVEILKIPVGYLTPGVYLLMVETPDGQHSAKPFMKK